jgi:hypothetical protein
MHNSNLISNTTYPKSNNHKITWKKNDNIKTCDLNQNCMEIIFDIKKNKNIKIINDTSQIQVHLPTIKSLSYEMFDSNSNSNSKYKLIGFSDFIYNIVSLILLVILMVILICKK